MMMKNEKVLGGSYGKWVQGTGPQVVVTALLRWNWAPLSKQWRISLTAIIASKYRHQPYSLSSAFRYCLTIRLEWVVIDP